MPDTPDAPDGARELTSDARELAPDADVSAPARDEAADVPAPKSRGRADVVGIAFVLVIVVVAAWALWDELPSVWRAMLRVGWWRVLLAVVSATAGLLATAEVWRHCLAALGARVRPAAARRIFFPAQAGKYLPGSVWPFIAQVRYARLYDVRPSLALLAGTVFLVVHLVTSVLVSALLLVSQPTLFDRFGWFGLAGLASLVLLHPRLQAFLVRKLSRRSDVRPPNLGWRDVGRPLAWMVPAWACYGLSGWLLAGPLGGYTPVVFVMSTGAFALGWLVGLLVVFAPAGVGAREAALVLAFTPALGIAGATTVALLLRVVHTAADVGLGLRYGLHARKKA